MGHGVGGDTSNILAQRFNKEDNSQGGLRASKSSSGTWALFLGRAAGRCLEKRCCRWSLDGLTGKDSEDPSEGQRSGRKRSVLWPPDQEQELQQGPGNQRGADPQSCITLPLP